MPTFPFLFSPGIFIPARGIGVVGAFVTSVGASATACLAGGSGRRWLFPAAAPFFGAAAPAWSAGRKGAPLLFPASAPLLGPRQGLPCPHRLANSSIVPKRWS